ncbi:MAG TPA: crossover junction endodeoxyribonuclease RuvC [bacterium]|nr:crossover junction endodeoxyribonuclease RuvC [bacterium]HMW33830.1 crossover junction endodeoxyribonuclease RuvC [bacterium]HMW37329.1 crossover junction endodeoxyribonuclease RuvC [bacterium]HMY36850.1 crossover junction endodeoxyribonuclease RuvC [bacterium]HMZ03861.1 crossover junction endodeoxyribonuclease RuvC [bacterium]
MVILGIDPGTNTTGFGIITWERNKVNWVASGTIELPEKETLARKLELIYDHVVDLAHTYKPNECAIENVFYSKNVKSALKLGHARAAAMLGALHKAVHISEYSPKDMKMAVVGNGNASKEQVQYMVKMVLGITKEMSFDESDALGLAICRAQRIKTPRASVSSWKAYIKAHPDRVKVK